MGSTMDTTGGLTCIDMHWCGGDYSKGRVQTAANKVGNVL